MEERKEVFKEIPNFPDYTISNYGRLKLKNGKISKAKPSHDGYIAVTLFNDKKVSKYIQVPKPRKLKIRVMDESD